MEPDVQGGLTNSSHGGEDRAAPREAKSSEDLYDLESSAEYDPVPKLLKTEEKIPQNIRCKNPC